MRIFKLGQPVFAAAALFAAFLTFSASASAQDQAEQGQNQKQERGGRTLVVSEPIEGTGLVGVVVAGGYLVWQRRRRLAHAFGSLMAGDSDHFAAAKSAPFSWLI